MKKLIKRFQGIKRNYSAHIKHLALTNAGEMTDFGSDNSFICEIIVFFDGRGERSFTAWGKNIESAFEQSMNSLDEFVKYLKQ